MSNVDSTFGYRVVNRTVHLKFGVLTTKSRVEEAVVWAIEHITA
ncbi:hypothetical protein [Ensifer sp. LBL]